jgi:hypothetical protein
MTALLPITTGYRNYRDADACNNRNNWLDFFSVIYYLFTVKKFVSLNVALGMYRLNFQGYFNGGAGYQ